MSETQDIGHYREIIRSQEGVHRPTGWWTPATQALLSYLEEAGYPYSPRILGADKEGREVLTYLDGESGVAGWQKIVSDEGPRRMARFLRTYHDAVRSYAPDASSEWAYASGGVKEGQIICHGDFGPWNLVWNGDEPVGLIDWDMAHPASPEEDVIYALEYAVPFRSDEDAVRWHHFEAPPDRKHRIKVFLKAYGSAPIENIVDKVAAKQRANGQAVRLLADM